MSRDYINRPNYERKAIADAAYDAWLSTFARWSMPTGGPVSRHHFQCTGCGLVWCSDTATRCPKCAAERFLDALQGFLTSTEGQTLDELDQELRESGIDPARFRQRVAALTTSRVEAADALDKEE